MNLKDFNIVLNFYLKFVNLGLTAAAVKGIKEISIPMIGSGEHGNDSKAMCIALIQSCVDYSMSTSVSNQLFIIS